MGGRILTHWPPTWVQDRHEGIDEFIMTNEGDEIPLQVKGSYRNVVNFEEKHPEIKCLLARPH